MAHQPLFDRKLIVRRFCHRTTPDFVAALVADDLAERLATLTRGFRSALVLGPDAAALPAAGRTAQGEFAFQRLSTLAGPAPRDPADLGLKEGAHDLVVSLLDLQAVDDVPLYLAQVRRSLVPDGLFLAAAIGGNSLTELRQSFLWSDAQGEGGVFARIAPMIEVRAAGALLQAAGLALPVVDIDTHIVRYPDPLALMSELKALGASNPLRDRPARMLTRTALLRAAARYAEQFADPDGRVRATLDLLWLSAWAPHKSQQQPLAPGSARTRLADVLGKRD